MSDYEINITPAGVSVAKQQVQTLFDAQGNVVEIPTGNHRSAIGIADYAVDPANPTAAELQAMQDAIAALGETVLGANNAVAVAAQASLLSAYNYVKTDRANKAALITQLQADLTAKNNEISTLNARITELEALVPSQPA